MIIAQVLHHFLRPEKLKNLISASPTAENYKPTPFAAVAAAKITIINYYYSEICYYMGKVFVIAPSSHNTYIRLQWIPNDLPLSEYPCSWHSMPCKLQLKNLRVVLPPGTRHTMQKAVKQVTCGQRTPATWLLNMTNQCKLYYLPTTTPISIETCFYELSKLTPCHTNRIENATKQKGIIKIHKRSFSTPKLDMFVDFVPFQCGTFRAQ